MNLFYLDNDMSKCVEYHVDKHVVKMPLEAAQIICTNLWIDKLFGFAPRALNKNENAELSKARQTAGKLPQEERIVPYLPTMQNHPCTIWARTSLNNLEWVFSYLHALGEEYTYRYGKKHKSVQLVYTLPGPKFMERVGFTKFGLAMPEHLKDYTDPVKAYRMYYMMYKHHLAKWKKREKPPWWDDLLVNTYREIT